MNGGRLKGRPSRVQREEGGAVAGFGELTWTHPTTSMSLGDLLQVDPINVVQQINVAGTVGAVPRIDPIHIDDIAPMVQVNPGLAEEPEDSNNTTLEAIRSYWTRWEDNMPTRPENTRFNRVIQDEVGPTPSEALIDNEIAAAVQSRYMEYRNRQIQRRERERELERINRPPTPNMPHQDDDDIANTF